MKYTISIDNLDDFILYLDDIDNYVDSILYIIKIIIII